MDPANNALTVQHGGDHYKGLAIQPIVLSMANQYDACIHSAIKYLSRHREKGGREDLNKTLHFCALRIVTKPEGYPAAILGIPIKQYIEQNEIALEEARIMSALDQWACKEFTLPDSVIFNHIKQHISALADMHYPEEEN